MTGSVTDRFLDDVKKTHEKLLAQSIALGEAGTLAAVRHRGAVDALAEVKRRVSSHYALARASRARKPARTECATCDGRGIAKITKEGGIVETRCPTCRGRGHIVRKVKYTRSHIAQLKRPCEECQARPGTICTSTKTGNPMTMPHKSR